jgi:hypothetical protein
MRAGAAPRAPRWIVLCFLDARWLRPSHSPLYAALLCRCERAPPLALPAGRASGPPDPLHMCLPRNNCTGTCFRYAETLRPEIMSGYTRAIRACHFSTRSHQIGVPRGNARGRGCRGRGRPLRRLRRASASRIEDAYGHHPALQLGGTVAPATAKDTPMVTPMVTPLGECLWWADRLESTHRLPRSQQSSGIAHNHGDTIVGRQYVWEMV